MNDPDNAPRSAVQRAPHDFDPAVLVDEPTPPRRNGLRRLVFGPPRDVKDPHTYHAVSLIALFAWVGLGADGLSSSAYGPDEAYRQLGSHTALAAVLAGAMALTVFIISYGYTRIIEQFPQGGGGYLVAGRLLGPRVGVISGAALLVDYVLTISISIASGADAIFSFLPPAWAPAKLFLEFTAIVVLTLMNLRGVKESITALFPIFVAFLVLHALLLAVAIGGRVRAFPVVSHEIHTNLTATVRSLTLFGTLKLFVRAYSLGGGTYTGIEAVSNGVAAMREPRVRTAKRTMALMATSLAATAGGILLSYLLVHAVPEPGKTMNAVLFERVMGPWHLGRLPIGHWLAILGLFSEGALLFVAAQAGFLDGPRVMANMANDSWLPRRFSALSDRLTMQNGVLMMGGAGLAVLLYTRGDVSKLVVMYAINVFLTFSLSNLGMVRYWFVHRAEHPGAWWRHVPAHLLALALCATILVITVVEKFVEGGWVTLAVTASLVAVCFWVKRHYADVARAIAQLDRDLPEHVVAPGVAVAGDVPDGEPVAVLFVGGYSGLGRHALLKLLSMLPGYVKGVVFCGVALLDSGVSTGLREVEARERQTREGLDRYVAFARRLGVPARSECRIGTEVPDVAEALAREILEKHPRALFIGGQLLFDRDNIVTRFLHNETAFAIQRRLQRGGIPMLVLPVRVSLQPVGREAAVGAGVGAG